MHIGKTISIIIGKGSIGHNNREFIAPNVDKSRTSENVTLICENLKDIYHEIFDEALSEYNAKQKRKDRIIKDYYEHIFHSKQENLFMSLLFKSEIKMIRNAVLTTEYLRRKFLNSLQKIFQSEIPI